MSIEHLVYTEHDGQDLDSFALFSVAGYAGSCRVLYTMVRNEEFYSKFHLNVVTWPMFKKQNDRKKKNPHSACFVDDNL